MSTAVKTLSRDDLYKTLEPEMGFHSVLVRKASAMGLPSGKAITIYRVFAKPVKEERP